MVFDSIKNIGTYNLSNDILDVLKHAENISAESYNTDKMILENGDFILPNKYQTQLRDKLVFEAHKKYIDVMYMLEGTEMILVKPTERLSNITDEYNPDGDYLLSEEYKDMTSVILKPGDFIILYPQDAHCPACAVDGNSIEVKKIICKVKIHN